MVTKLQDVSFPAERVPAQDMWKLTSSSYTLFKNVDEIDSLCH